MLWQNSLAKSESFLARNTSVYTKLQRRLALLLRMLATGWNGTFSSTVANHLP
ncbi:MAG TPA: hypothetical protein VKY31_16065 [Terriglobia bacterium]|nr:hypothetical protein [Terriglobia bacterium]